MKRLAAFLKVTTVGGLLVVLPAIVVLGILTKILLGVHSVAQSLVEKLVGKESEAAEFPIIFSILTLLVISFGFGLIMSWHGGQAAGDWLERKILFRIPGYAAVRSIVSGLAGASHEGAVRPGLLTVDPGIECFVIVMEDSEPDRLTVYIPGSPNPGSGNVQIVRRDLVRLLNVRVMDIGSALQQWGVGSTKVLAKDRAAALLRG